MIKLIISHKKALPLWLLQQSGFLQNRFSSCPIGVSSSSENGASRRGCAYDDDEGDDRWC